ncbi:LLM class flavin-dependent oxidoreductase [Herbaspirillum sp. NPDC087042]|uniref:LLM class flavin-dependent oxidoreductase n=1 Tax=Herbaspirillum sp. NPDC087042 TaxID=3364004 RepID=UPI00380D491F
MSVNFIGMVTTNKNSEIHTPVGPAIDTDYLLRFARAHEEAGFDRVLVPYHSTGPDAILTIAQVAAATQRIKLMLAHRPGFVAPTLAARQLATLDHFSGGRLGVHIISGGSDSEQRRDGDYLDHDQRYARTDEYLEILRKVWTSGEPFDHHGEFYRVEQAFSEVRPVQQPHLPIFFGGASEAAIPVAGRHADIYALWGESLDQVRELTGRVRAEAAGHGRKISFSVSFRPILAATEDAAWERAERILAETRRLRSGNGKIHPTYAAGPQQSEGARRLLAAADRGSRVDKRLWTAIAKETGARYNSTALVGTPGQVAEALLDYYDLGVTNFLIRGFDPLEDAIDYGRELIPRTRELVAQRQAQAIAA